MGGNFDMKVEVGEPGEGSMFNLETTTITFDPLHLERDPEEAKFIAGHEGAHRAISPGPREIGLTKRKEEQLYSRVGFGYMQNVIEDPAVNDWLSHKFPGLRPNVEKTYDRMLEKENAVISTPEATEFAQYLGYWPKFSQWGSEVIRYWHQKRFSEQLDPDVKQALEATIGKTSESIADIPGSEETERKKIVSFAQKRFKRNTEEVWPEVEKLVEMDLHTEEIRQMLNEFFKKMLEMEQKQKQGEQATENNDEKGFEEIAKQIEQLQKEMQDFSGLSQKAKEEIEEKISSSAKASEDKKEEEGEGEEEEGEPSFAKASADKEGDLPYPESEISEETKQELEQMHKNLPASKKMQLRQKAQDVLDQFEDMENKGMQGKLNEDNPESHSQMNEKENSAEKAIKQSQETKEDRKRIEDELKRIRLENMNAYEKARDEVSDLSNSLYTRLRSILKPEEFGGQEAGWPSGTEMDIGRAMQSKMDSMQKQRMWSRESAPEKKDYRFWHLIDLSSSMADSGKIQEAFKGFVASGEAIDRLENLNSDTLTIHQGITGFHNRVFHYKGMEQRFDKQIEDEISTMPNRVHDDDAGTNTYAGTLAALEKIQQNLGESGNFVLTFSDGEPNWHFREPLKRLLEESKEQRKKKKIKVGLIWLGYAQDEEYMRGLVQEFGYDFGLVMPATKLSEAERQEGKKDFSSALSDLLEDIVKNPERY